MNFIEHLDKLIKDSGEEPLFTGTVDDSTIKEFEAILGVPFPKSYKEFIKEYGALSFCGNTYYGITGKGKNEKKIPCVLFVTQNFREQGDISDKMIIIKSSGYGPLFSIDTETIGTSGEPVIVETELSFKRDGIKKIVADNYGEFILKSISEAIEDL